MCGAESTMRVQLRAVSNQLPRMNRWRRIRSRRRPRAPGTSFAFAPPCCFAAFERLWPKRLGRSAETKALASSVDATVGPAKLAVAPGRDVNQAVDVTGGRSHARVCLSRAHRAPPLIGLGGARANGMMAARAVVHGFCARSGAVLCHDGSA